MVSTCRMHLFDEDLIVSDGALNSPESFLILGTSIVTVWRDEIKASRLSDSTGVDLAVVVLILSLMILDVGLLGLVAVLRLVILAAVAFGLAVLLRLAGVFPGGVWGLAVVGSGVGVLTIVDLSTVWLVVMVEAVDSTASASAAVFLFLVLFTVSFSFPVSTSSVSTSSSGRDVTAGSNPVSSAREM